MDINNVERLYTPAALRAQLESVPESDFIRTTATWMSRAKNWTDNPGQSENAIINALTGAACGHLAVQHGDPFPPWASETKLDSFWHPGHPGMFAWSFAHTPAAFKVLGIIVERDSLQCV